MTVSTLDRSVSSILDAAAAAKVTTMLVGAPGTGKTESVIALAKAKGYSLITIVPSRMDPTEVAGNPKAVVVTIEGEDGEKHSLNATENLAPAWQVRILTKKKVVLFFDEFSNATPAVRAALLTILQNREFPNGQKMPDETILIGAMNPASQAADGYELDLPTSNRLLFIPWNPSWEAWCEGALENWGHPMSEAEALWKQRVVNFIRENPGSLHQEPQDVGNSQAYGVNPNNASEMEVLQNAWASRRSWDNLTKVLGSLPESAQDDVNIQDMVAQGLIGYSVAGKFREWLQVQSKITPSKALKNPEEIAWESMDLSDAHHLLRAVTDSINENTILQVLAVFTSAADAGFEHYLGAYLPDLVTKGANDKWKNKDANKKAIMGFIAKHRGVLGAQKKAS